jgi:SAM-dependent methyltransferase
MGAGTGADLLVARARCPGARLLALEGVQPNVEKLTTLGLQATLHDLERDRFPFEDEYLDVVIANQILEHTKEIYWILHEISRTLRVGGRLIIGVPNLAALHNRVLLGLGQQPSPIKTLSAHVRGFTRGDLLAFLEGCFPGGYRLIDFRGANFYPFPPLLARSLARLFPTLAWGIFFLLEKAKPYSREFLDTLVSKKLETPFYAGSQ